MEHSDHAPQEERRRRAALPPAPEHRRRLAGALLIAALVAFAIDSALGPGAGDGAGSAVADKPALSLWQEARVRLDRESGLVARTLERTPYVSRGDGRRRKVALTFDDGPGAQTPAILSILERFDAKATFFSLGGAVEQHPRQNRAEILAGHAVGNHSWDHPRLAGLAGAEQERQIDATTDALRAEGPRAPSLFRPPYGSFDATTLDLLAERDLLMVLWSVDATDFGGTDAAGIATRVLGEIEPGSIVLMHDGGGDRSQTVAALPRVLRGLERRNFDAVTVPELLATNPPAEDQPPPIALDGMP